MYNENKQAHEEIEKFLRSGSGQSLGQVAVILGVHRTTIQGYSSDLQGFIGQYTVQFSNHFKEGGPNSGPKVKPAGNGTKPDQSTDGPEPPAGTPIRHLPRRRRVARGQLRRHLGKSYPGHLPLTAAGTLHRRPFAASES